MSMFLSRWARAGLRLPPDAAVFAPRAGHAAQLPRAGLRRSALYQTIEFRRTIIPILLTCGVLMIGFGSLKYVMGEDSPLSELPVWLPVGPIAGQFVPSREIAT